MEMNKNVIKMKKRKREYDKDEKRFQMLKKLLEEISIFTKK
jgi:hypothetical protein